MEPALPQKLYLMTDTNVLAKLRAPEGRVQTLLCPLFPSDAADDLHCVDLRGLRFI